MLARRHRNPIVTGVNHDLIAAGHPRLAFEFTSYLAQMPKHWNEVDDWEYQDRKRNSPASERIRREQPFWSNAWWVGQIAASRQSLCQLASRAASATMPQVGREATGSEDSFVTWPEFAEYDCFACHHDLRPSDWRRKNRIVSEDVGVLPWGGWYFSMTRHIADRFGANELVANLDRLSHEMSQLRPDASTVEKLARNAHIQLGQLSFPQENNDLELSQLLTHATSHSLQRRSWEEITQYFHSIVALYVAQRRTRPNPSRDAMVFAALEKLYEMLQFETSSQTGYGYDSPNDDDANQEVQLDEVLSTLQQILTVDEN